MKFKICNSRQGGAFCSRRFIALKAANMASVRAGMPAKMFEARIGSGSLGSILTVLSSDIIDRILSRAGCRTRARDDGCLPQHYLRYPLSQAVRLPHWLRISHKKSKEAAGGKWLVLPKLNQFGSV